MKQEAGLALEVADVSSFDSRFPDVIVLWCPVKIVRSYFAVWIDLVNNVYRTLSVNVISI